MAGIHDLTALELASAVRARELSPVEIAEHFLARTDEVGAFVTVTAEIALDQARRLENEDPGDRPLFGVPVPVKDLNFVKGVPVRFGSATYQDFIAPVDDSIVTRLREAGTVLTGKTNTPEFGLPCYTEPAFGPPARTPWDVTRSAGGSSGGAAAAVAAGLAPVAHGSDGAGSIRIPAAACGLFGIKPSRGRVSFAPMIPDLAGLSANGPLARNVADAAALLDVLAHHQPGDMYWAPDPGTSFSAHVGRDPGKLRIARYCDPVVEGAELHTEVIAAYDHATKLLERLGHEVVDIPNPYGADTVALFERMWFSFACMHVVAPDREHLLRPVTAWLRERGFATSAPDFLRAQSAIQLATRFALLVTDEFDAVLTPTVTGPTPEIGWFEDVEDPAETFARMKRFAPFAAVYNVSGQPSVNLPIHWTPEGLPIGVMLGGRWAGEGTLIALSAQVEAAVGGFWGERRPPGW
ncbi:amidase [Herbidospora mongoliensis]|uniref:amidase n=1 Tax=Herbidospora mongoliensis TaxID=688067 RepID=UPI00083230C8|nr:amidase [Herbidospora mongoliensis]